MRRILFVGSNASASWQIRGEQLGREMGAVMSNMGDPLLHCRTPDLAVLVKRPHQSAVEQIRRCGIPIVWDVVDAWPQPMGNWWARDVCVQWLKGQLKRIGPVAVVASTAAMAADLASSGLPVLVLPHHARPGLGRSEIREQIKAVGYEGSHTYITGWRGDLETCCTRRGWGFEPKPASLGALDIIVAVRDADGYAAKNWKSNVKLANAQAAGVPCVMNRERAYLETASGAELWADTPAEMDAALDTLAAENGARRDRADKLHAATPTLGAVAVKYRAWLESL